MASEGRATTAALLATLALCWSHAHPLESGAWTLEESGYFDSPSMDGGPSLPDSYPQYGQNVRASKTYVNQLRRSGLAEGDVENIETSEFKENEGNQKAQSQPDISSIMENNRKRRLNIAERMKALRKKFPRLKTRGRFGEKTKAPEQVVEKSEDVEESPDLKTFNSNSDVDLSEQLNNDLKNVSKPKQARPSRISQRRRTAGQNSARVRQKMEANPNSDERPVHNTNNRRRKIQKPNFMRKRNRPPQAISNFKASENEVNYLDDSHNEVESPVVQEDENNDAGRKIIERPNESLDTNFERNHPSANEIHQPFQNESEIENPYRYKLRMNNNYTPSYTERSTDIIEKKRHVTSFSRSGSNIQFNMDGHSFSTKIPNENVRHQTNPTQNFNFKNASVRNEVQYVTEPDIHEFETRPTEDPTLWAFDPHWSVPDAKILSTETYKSEPTKVPGSQHLVTHKEFPYEFWSPADKKLSDKGLYPKNRQTSEGFNPHNTKVPDHMFSVGAGPVSIPEDLVRKDFHTVTAAPSFDLTSNPFEGDSFKFNHFPAANEVEVTLRERRRPPPITPRNFRPNVRRSTPFGNIMNALRPNTKNVKNNRFPPRNPHARPSPTVSHPYNSAQRNYLKRPVHDFDDDKFNPSKPIPDLSIRRHKKREFPKSTLAEHRPPTRPGARPHRSREQKTTPATLERTRSHFDVKHVEFETTKGFPQSEYSTRLGSDRSQGGRNRELPHRRESNYEMLPHRPSVGPHQPAHRPFDSRHPPQRRQSLERHPPQRHPQPHRPPHTHRPHPSHQRQPPPHHPGHNRHRPSRHPPQHFRRPEAVHEEDSPSLWSRISDFDFSFLNPFSRDDSSEDNFSGVDRVATSGAVLSSSLMVPGGLAILGAGLSLFYFNYGWLVQTPVVKARLVDVVMKTLHSNSLTEDQQRAISDVTKVMKKLSLM